MAQKPLPICPFLFGVELELLLTRKPQAKGEPWTDWSDAADSLSKLLQQNSIPNEVFSGDVAGTPNYKLWNLVMDGSIGRADPKLQKWGVELVSNIRFDTKKSDWAREQKKVWHTVESNFEINPSDTCGTHVHVSLPSLRGFNLERMQRVGKAVVYFERCIDSIVPAHRRQNAYCRSNRYNNTLRRFKSMPDVFKAIEGTKTHAELADLLSPDRYFRWNFRHMAKEARPAKLATVEFRQPPGSTTVDDALFWQRFTLAFIGGALTLQSFIDPEREPSLALLARFVSKGTVMCRSVNSDGFEAFINGKKKLPEGMFPETDGTSKKRAPVRVQNGTADLQPRKLETAYAAELCSIEI